MNDCNWHPISEFPTLKECPKLKDKQIIIVTDLGWAFGAFYDGRKGFSIVNSDRNHFGKIDLFNHIKKESVVLWCFVPTEEKS